MFSDVEVDCFGLTDCGKVRKVNQDQFLIATMHKMLEIQQGASSCKTGADFRRQLEGNHSQTFGMEPGKQLYMLGQPLFK